MYLRLLKEHHAVPTLVGGVHATMASEAVIGNPHVDIVCRGEGEIPMLRLVEAMSAGSDISRIESMWVKKGPGEIVRNEIAPLIQNLDDLPFPDREFFPMESILKENGYAMVVLAGRGCPFSCAYCSNSAYLKLYRGKGRYVRRRSVGNVIEELKMLRERYRIGMVGFQDEIFTMDKKWLKEFCEAYRRKIGIGFSCCARPENIDCETAAILKGGGCLSVSIGVETGDEVLRRTVLNRSTSNGEIVTAFRLLREAGIKRMSFNMIGVPGETLHTIEQSLSFARGLEPDWVGLTLYHPYPGTQLAELCERKGYVKKRAFNPSYGSEESMLTLPTISSRELTRGYRRFEDYAFGLYVRDKYPALYPLYLLVKPLLKTPMRKFLIELAYRVIHNRGVFRRDG
jgi:radical SAM superfamily enzyme YgiQ (UPF0313 family)